jgi:hypothetical protein
LQHVAGGEGSDRVVRDDMHQEVDHRGALRFHVLGDLGRLYGRDRNACAWVDDVGDDDPDQQADGRQYFELQQGLQSDPPDLAHIARLRDARDHREEHDRPDDHLDQAG